MRPAVFLGDLGQVRPQRAAGASDGVTIHALQAGRLEEQLLAARRISLQAQDLLGLDHAPESLDTRIGTRARLAISVALIEILFGSAVGWLSLRARHWARDPQVEITLSLITPYVAYWVPEHFGGSGVIATVACGLYMSWNGPLLISSATRLQGIFFWDLIIYLIEGLLFLLTGFQMRLLYEKSKAFPLDDILVATALVSVIVIVARFAWVYPATYLPRMMSKSLRQRDPSPPWQWVFILSFAGLRGAVSLAAALALPFVLTNGDPFPDRDLILFVSFGVIFVTRFGA